MAVIKFGSIVTSGRGSLGGSTVQSCRSGHIWRNKPFPKKSRTQAQSVIRSYNKAMQAGWRSLTDQQRKLWNDYAKVKPVFNRSGEKHPLSGHSLWMKYQYGRVSFDLSLLSDPADYKPDYFGTEKVYNGGFDSQASWSVNPDFYIADGLLNYKAVANDYLVQSNPLPVDVPLKVEFDISLCPRPSNLYFQAAAAGTLFYPPYDGVIFITNGHYRFYSSIPAYLTYFSIRSGAVGFPFSMDNLSFKSFL